MTMDQARTLGRVTRALDAAYGDRAGFLLREEPLPGDLAERIRALEVTLVELGVDEPRPADTLDLEDARRRRQIKAVDEASEAQSGSDAQKEEMTA